MIPSLFRITKLEITLDSFGYREFIPFVKVLLFEKNETLWHLLDATIDIESLVPKVAIHCAFEAKLFEVGEAFDEHSTDGMSPNEMQNHSHSVEVEDYYEKNVEQVQDAVMSILHHPRCRNLYYTLSSQTEPESKPTRLIQDEVACSIRSFDLTLFFHVFFLFRQVHGSIKVSTDHLESVSRKTSNRILRLILVSVLLK